MLSVLDLSVVRGDKCLFAGVGFSLQPGQWLHLQGNNGAGKTSLLRVVCGLSPAAHGQVLWKQQPIQSNPDDYRASMAYLGHALALKDDLSAQENLLSEAAIQAHALTAEAAMAALARLGLRGREHLPVRVLSQGQKRRAALARVIASPARLWVLDEPFATLDTQAQTVLADLVSVHVNGGGMVLFTSHQPVPVAGQGSTYRLSA